MMFSACSLKMGFLFPTNIKLLFCQKSKDKFFPENTPKDDIRPRKDDIGILD